MVVRAEIRAARVSEKPLHVRVAQAMGWNDCEQTDTWRGTPPRWMLIGRLLRCDFPVPHYDTDWSATGPLIEKYRLCIVPNNRDALWQAQTGNIDGTGLLIGEGPSPLIAACDLILALKEAGKL